MMAKFDMPGIKKQDVHVSFQRSRLVVTWETVNVTEREENERIVRERKEKIFSETIPLPDGTKVGILVCCLLRVTYHWSNFSVVRRSPRRDG